MIPRSHKRRGSRKAEATRHSSPERTEQQGAGDDAVIGRAFRWSMLVLLLIGCVVAFGILRRLSPADPPPPRPNVVHPPKSIEAEVDPPTMPFTDITGEAGLQFTHVTGAAGEKLLPETMGGGCAFLDYNRDGHPDILLINCKRWPHEDSEAKPPTMALYRNDGTGHFEEVTESVGLDVTMYGMGAAVGDYDNDGDPDVLITALGPNRMFRNDDGVFTEITGRANLAGDPDAWNTSAGFFDYDRDSDLDLFICNYVKWSRKLDLSVDTRLTGIGKAYVPPTHFEGTFSDLYRNNGDGTFTEVSEDAGLHVRNEATGAPVGKALAITFPDINSDGWLDIFVANDTVRNFCFVNQGDGTFAERGQQLGLAYNNRGMATSGMGVDAGRFRNGSRLGIFIGNYATEMTSAYVSLGRNRMFLDVARIQGLGPATRPALTFGLFLFDPDLNGRLDLLQANGHIEPEINKVQRSQNYRQAGQLFWNAGPEHTATFVEVPKDRVGDLSKQILGRGAAYADIDADGDQDVLLTQINGPPLLLRNDRKQSRHWLRCTLVSGRSNRDAIGAVVELSSDGITQRRRVMPTRSYLSQVERTLTFGLGKAERIESVKIIWPDGSTQRIDPPKLDQAIHIQQAEPKSG